MNGDDYIFDVEKILDKRIKNGRIEYKIKWDNYPMCQCTWEPVKNLTNVQYMIDEFNNKLQEKAKRSKSQSGFLGKKRKNTQKLEKNEKPEKKNEDFKKNSKKADQNSKNSKNKSKALVKYSSKRAKQEDDKEEDEEEEEEEEENNSGSSSSNSLKNSSSSTSSVCYSGKKKGHKKGEKEDNIKIDHTYKKVYTVQIKEGKLVAVVGIKNSQEKYKDNIATDELRKKNPWILLDFYESKIKFT